MHVITVASSFAATVNILFALRVHEISYRRVDGAYLFTIEKPAIDIFQSILRILLVTIFNIDVSNNVIAEVVDYDHILNLSILTHFLEYFFKEGLKSN